MNNKTEFRRVQGFSAVVGLPAASHPWRMVQFDGRTIATNPEHPPMVIVGGKAEPFATGASA